MSINKNNYVPKYTPLEERDFLSYLDNLKYERYVMDPDAYFKNVKIINFNIICNQILGEPMHKPIETYQTVHEADLTKYTPDVKEEFVSSAMRKQDDTMQPIYFEKSTVRNHFRVPFSSKKNPKEKDTLKKEIVNSIFRFK